MLTVRNHAIAAALLGIAAAAAPVNVTFAAPPPADVEEDYQDRLGVDELKDLAAPVALYPDAILAQVLVACTYPDDVISAQQWLKAGHDPAEIDDQKWDLSVKGVARYPGTLEYLANHFDWMNDIGDAFLHQEADVMLAVQILRAEANAAGNLPNTDQQRVIVDNDVIEIVPTDPEIIYVPQYDPRVVYVERPYVVGRRWDPLITFGVGIHVGGWLHHDCDWHDHTIYVGDWGRDRPWWHHDDRRGGNVIVHRYVDDRPGTHITKVVNKTVVNNRTVVRNNIEPGRWAHDDHKPAPRAIARPGVRTPDRRSGSGYPAVGRANSTLARERSHDTVVPGEDRGAIAARASDRGRTSRANQRHTAPQAKPAPKATPAPRPAPAARPAPAERQAPAAARPTSPDRGAAIRGYQNGAGASRSSDRGAASRGGGGASSSHGDGGGGASSGHGSGGSGGGSSGHGR